MTNCMFKCLCSGAWTKGKPPAKDEERHLHRASAGKSFIPVATFNHVTRASCWHGNKGNLSWAEWQCWKSLECPLHLALPRPLQPKKTLAWETVTKKTPSFACKTTQVKFAHILHSLRNTLWVFKVLCCFPQKKAIVGACILKANEEDFWLEPNPG